MNPLAPRSAAAALVLGVLALPATPASAAPEAVAANPCSGTKAVKTEPLKTSKGVFLGKAKIAYGRKGDDTAVCAVVQVAKKYRKSGNYVSRAFRKLSEEGEVLGRIGTVEPADDLFPMAFSSSYEPTGYTFVLKAAIDVGTKGRATLTYLVEE